MWIQRTIRQSIFREFAPDGFRSTTPRILGAAAAALLLASCSRSSNVDLADAAPPSPAPRPSRTQEALATITGKVRISGKLPAPPALQTNSSVERQCGKEIPDRTLLVDKEGALANALVFLADVERSSSDRGSSSPKALLDQRGCAYLPPVIAARAGATLEVLNSDPLMHNVRASAESPLFNFAMPLQGQKVDKQLPARPAIIRVGCDVHPWMHAVIRTFDHPYFAPTDSNGRYQLAIPAGKKKVAFWHERFPEQSVTVEVAAGQSIERDAQWPASQLHR